MSRKLKNNLPKDRIDKCRPKSTEKNRPPTIPFDYFEPLYDKVVNNKSGSAILDIGKSW